MQDSTPKKSKTLTKLSEILFKQKIQRIKKKIKPILGIMEKIIVELKGAPS